MKIVTNDQETRISNINLGMNTGSVLSNAEVILIFKAVIKWTNRLELYEEEINAIIILFSYFNHIIRVEIFRSKILRSTSVWELDI
jgi:hypothetical protein